MTADVYQESLTRWVPDLWRVTPNKYEYHLWGQLQYLTKRLPGRRFMDDKWVQMAYSYTPETAINQMRESGVLNERNENR